MIIEGLFNESANCQTGFFFEIFLKKDLNIGSNDAILLNFDIKKYQNFPDISQVLFESSYGKLLNEMWKIISKWTIYLCIIYF